MQLVAVLTIVLLGATCSVGRVIEVQSKYLCFTTFVNLTTKRSPAFSEEARKCHFAFLDKERFSMTRLTLHDRHVHIRIRTMVDRFTKHHQFRFYKQGFAFKVEGNDKSLFVISANLTRQEDGTYRNGQLCFVKRLGTKKKNHMAYNKSEDFRFDYPLPRYQADSGRLTADINISRVMTHEFFRADLANDRFLVDFEFKGDESSNFTGRNEDELRQLFEKRNETENEKPIEDDPSDDDADAFEPQAKIQDSNSKKSRTVLLVVVGVLGTVVLVGSIAIAFLMAKLRKRESTTIPLDEHHSTVDPDHEK